MGIGTLQSDAVHVRATEGQSTVEGRSDRAERQTSHSQAGMPSSLPFFTVIFAVMIRYISYIYYSFSPHPLEAPVSK